MESIGNDLLSEVHLKTYGMKRQERVDLIKQAYLSVLSEDDSWHFFYEEEMGDIIRCSPENLKQLELFFIDKEISFESNKLWVETIPDVVNNPEYFAQIFHLNSEFIINNALKLNPEQKMESMAMFVDRFSHSLYLNYAFVNGDVKFGEPQVLSECILMRALYEGRRYQFILDKPYLDRLREQDAQKKV